MQYNPSQQKKKVPYQKGEWYQMGALFPGTNKDTGEEDVSVLRCKIAPESQQKPYKDHPNERQMFIG